MRDILFMDVCCVEGIKMATSSSTSIIKSATEAVVQPVTLECTIKDVSQLCQLDQPPLKSSVYSCEGMDLQLEVKYYLNNVQTYYVSVQFSLVSCKYSLPLRAQYDISLFKQEKEYKMWTNQWTTIEALQTNVGAEKENWNLSSYLTNDEMKIKCNIRFVLQAKHTQKASKHLTVPQCDLKANLGSLLQEGRMSDVTLVAGGQSFPAHTVILAARSPVFERMFAHDMRESSTSEVSITDIEPPTLQEMLLYIYTGELSSNDHKKLFYAADKYQLARLKVLCENELSKTISIDNSTEILFLTDLHEAKQLKEKCVAYIATHRSAVMQTPRWSEVAARSDLVLEILQATAT